MKTEKRDLGYYMALPYTKSLRPDRDGDVVAQIRELQGWSAHGQDERDAVANLEESQRLWLEDCLITRDPVPEPEQGGPLPIGFVP
jgi:predicted RNase H-like HicB family nuclease